MRLYHYIYAAGMMTLCVMVGCTNATIPFATYQRQEFAPTPITTSQEKTIQFVNPSVTDPQRIAVIAFDAGGNAGGNFKITKVMAGGRELGTKEVVVPAGEMLEVTFQYTPRNMETTYASYGGWETGTPEEFKPHAPKAVYRTSYIAHRNALESLVGSSQLLRTTNHKPRTTKAASSTPPEAIHRALVILTYDFPQEGVAQVELIGRAVPGPNGEISASGGGGGTTAPGECKPGGSTACFTGKFSLDLPGLMKSGAVIADLSGAMPITIDGSSAEVDMNNFPPVLFLVKGNGPGEPLEGKPIGALSIVISGTPDVVATGTFDGSDLQLSDVGFRIRIYLAEIALEDADGTTAPADFLVNGVTLATTKPLADGIITFHIETNLSAAPANNPLVDPFLAGAKVVVEMEGALELP